MSFSSSVVGHGESRCFVVPVLLVGDPHQTGEGADTVRRFPGDGERFFVLLFRRFHAKEVVVEPRPAEKRRHRMSVPLQPGGGECVDPGEVFPTVEKNDPEAEEFLRCGVDGGRLVEERGGAGEVVSQEGDLRPLEQRRGSIRLALRPETVEERLRLFDIADRNQNRDGFERFRVGREEIAFRPRPRIADLFQVGPVVFAGGVGR